MVSDVYRTLWRSKLLVVLITAIVVAVAFVLTSRQTELYTAYSLVRVQQKVQREDELFGAFGSPASDSPARMSASRRRPAYGRSSILGCRGT